MIDLGLLRQNRDIIINLLKRKDPAFDGQRLWELDQHVLRCTVSLEELRQHKNQLAEQAKSGVTPEIRSQSIHIGTSLKLKEQELAALREQFNTLYLSCPNVPSDDLPVGNKESNKITKTVGTKPTFNFTPKNHIDLAKVNQWIDFDAAARMTGSNFVLYKNDGVRLLYALSMFMLKNNIKYGYAPILPPALINEKSLEIASNFPKFKDQVYAVRDDALYLTPTAEVNMANLYREHIFLAKDLPVRMTAWTSCFRREAGSYGAHERGLIRIHQFEKVELYTICEPSNSSQELDRMIACAENILQTLDLHYQITLLATQDCSFASAKTYDIEVWFPEQRTYKEVSSCSNCTDFQARRGLIRYRAQEGKKTRLVHTLNASSLALPRLMVAIMETYQQPDGTIAIPNILKSEGIFTV
jgi:seryl-tRNA synthetase